jgi:hypothetical protein
MNVRGSVSPLFPVPEERLLGIDALVMGRGEKQPLPHHHSWSRLPRSISRWRISGLLLVCNMHAHPSYVTLLCAMHRSSDHLTDRKTPTIEAIKAIPSLLALSTIKFSLVDRT